MSEEPEPSGPLSWLAGELPPGQRVLSLFAAKWVIGALRPLVQLNVPDLLADGPHPSADLAVRCGADPDALHRALRCAASVGLFTHGQDGAFGLTALTEGLREGVPGSIRDMFLFAADPMMWRPYEDGLHSLRTGTPAFDHVFGQSFFEYVKANPNSGALFDRAMTQNSYPATDQMLADYDFGRFATIADVGGGVGQVLADVLRRHPASLGVLCDLPHVVADAKAVLERNGVADRVRIVETDFFVSVPGGCDAYLIKHALHNWDNAHAGQVLDRIREAIGDDAAARLLIVDMLLAPAGESDVGKLTDIEMLMILGGRERSREEWDALLAGSRFAPSNEPAPGNLALLEYRPV